MCVHHYFLCSPQPPMRPVRPRSRRRGSRRRGRLIMSAVCDTFPWLKRKVRAPTTVPSRPCPLHLTKRHLALFLLHFVSAEGVSIRDCFFISFLFLIEPFSQDTEKEEKKSLFFLKCYLCWLKDPPTHWFSRGAFFSPVLKKRSLWQQQWRGLFKNGI